MGATILRCPRSRSGHLRLGYVRAVSEPEDPSGKPERCCFDDWVDSWDRKTTKSPTAAVVTASLVDALEQAGLADRTVLDVGCGIGDLAIAAVALGACNRAGYDRAAAGSG